MTCKRMGLRILAVLMALALSNGSAKALQEKPEKSKSKAKVGQEVKSPQQAGKPAQAAAADGDKVPEDIELGPRKWRRVQQVKRLRADVLSRMELSPEEVSRIKAVFAKTLKGAYKDQRWWATMPKPHPLLSPERRTQLEGELAAAEKAGDDEAFKRLRDEIARGTLTAPDNLPPTDEDFMLMGLREQFKPDQLPAFEATLDRWRALECPTPRDGPLRMLRRAGNDAGLQLSQKQRKELDAILEHAHAELTIAREQKKKGSKPVLAAVAHEEILKILNAQQTKLFEADIAEFKRRDAERENFRIHSKNLRQKRRPAGAPPRRGPKPGGGND